MPEVPAMSSSAWNALLKSALSETIQPKVERWRSRLDALLVFSSSEDQMVRTNELLANLTDIIIAINRVPTGRPPDNPSQFVPPRSDRCETERITNPTQLSIAAIAVACRGFLNMRFLGPTIQLLPQILVIPVLLFILGLLDTLFSSVLQLSPVPKPILFTSGLSLLFISALAFLLFYTLTHRSINPSGLPFQWTAV
ncbi:hypothetical protein GGX14DRAFT_564961 [Mycena pura]|uniref:Uncharacterized protein n=1 Tax=Mycena pura TaxID=153505 RepID=A0AAD6YE70_9AGAR|nr:hypothetical protein GGX14DRAFT_564961 [Mycena pura]